MNDRRRDAGFTLIEIMVSMVLLVIGLLGVIALHATTVKGNRMSRELERARVYAAQIMEDTRGKEAVDLVDTDLPDVTTTDGVVYKRNYDVTDSGGMKMVTVHVKFYEDGSSEMHEATLQMLRTTQEKL